LVDDHEALQRFTREAENASKLSHPNVASIFDFGETRDGIVFLAMEFIEGESLHATLEREKALHPLVAADVIGQSADALQAAHDIGILHRDLKPDNLMLSKRADGTYLVKLGRLRHCAHDGQHDHARDTHRLRCWHAEYMSPEQLAGDVLDARRTSMHWALVAFAALTRRRGLSSVNSEGHADPAASPAVHVVLRKVRKDIDWPVTLQSTFDPRAGDRKRPTASSASPDFADELANAINGDVADADERDVLTRVAGARASVRGTPERRVQTCRRKRSPARMSEGTPCVRSLLPQRAGGQANRHCPLAQALPLPQWWRSESSCMACTGSARASRRRSARDLRQDRVDLAHGGSAGDAVHRSHAQCGNSAGCGLGEAGVACAAQTRSESCA
jgi:serine/threonine-protein kinase